MTTQLFLVAQIARRLVAIDSAEVESVVDIQHITPIPMADREVRGLAALRSRVVTVIDTCAALGLPESDPPARRAVITLVDGHHYAVLVDALEDVSPFELLPLSNGVALEAGWARAGYGMVDRGGEPMLAIRLRSVIPGLSIAA